MPQRLLLFFCLASVANASTLAPFTLNFSGIGGPSAVQGITLTGGLNFTYGLAQLPGGSLVYGQSLPTSSVGLFYGNGPDTTGSVWVQAKQSGGFDAPQKIVDGLAGVVTDVRTFSDGTILVDSGAGSLNTRKLSFYSSTGQSKGSLTFDFPGAWAHSTGMSLVRDNGNGTSTVFFIVGSRADAARTTQTVTISGLNLPVTTLNGDSIYQVNVNTAGSSVQLLGAPVQVATGFRNAYGLAFDNAGNLFVANNGIDGAHVHDQLGADALFKLPAGQLGVTLFDGGFPESYVDFQTGQMVNGNPNAAVPVVAYRPVLNSQNQPQSSEGAAGMAFISPGSLGTGALGGMLTTFHGVFDAAGAANYDNALALFDIASGKLTPILDAGTAGVGHIDSVLVEGNTIYLSDFSKNGLVNSLDGLGQGVIYQFDFPVNTPEPATWLGVATALAAVAAIRFRRN